MKAGCGAGFMLRMRSASTLPRLRDSCRATAFALAKASSGRSRVICMGEDAATLPRCQTRHAAAPSPRNSPATNASPSASTAPPLIFLLFLLLLPHFRIPLPPPSSAVTSTPPPASSSAPKSPIRPCRPITKTTSSARLTKGYRNRLRAFKHLLEIGRISENDRSKVAGHLSYAQSVEKSS